MLEDIEIAQSAKIKPIREIAAQLNIEEGQIEYYGKYKAKLPLDIIKPERVAQSNLILVTAITPTPAGEGKTTVSIGLADGLRKLNKKTSVVLREPSLGPVFGIKGGATGGGYSQVIPMEDINLHFTGDFSAIEKANNLLSALIDNNIQDRKRGLGIDPRTVLWKRAIDMNDRALRNIMVGLGGRSGGVPAETGFNITAASEVMAILCLSKNIEDLKVRLGNIYIGDTFEKKPVYAKDLQAEGAMATLLKDAIKPNLVQTMEGTPAFIHGGPFANIAQGTNSIIATKMAMSLSDYVVTEAGFGADLGAEKFLNIKCREAAIAPKVVVLVATVRALKYHGGQPLKELNSENKEALLLGVENLERHINTIKGFGLPVVVCVNAFSNDTENEISALQDVCQSLDVSCVVSEGFTKGGDGTAALAQEVTHVIARRGDDAFKPTYSLDESIEQKITKVCKAVYGANGIELSKKAKRQLKRFKELGYDQLPICMAKTQKSLSDDESKIGAPKDFIINIREFEIASGAGFVIPITGNILRMPGLPTFPAAEKISIDNNGVVSGLS